MTNRLLGADGVSAVLEVGGGNVLIVDGSATGGNCRILKADGTSDLLLANGSDHLLLFNCVPTAPGDGCRILKADGTSALLLANGVDHLLLFNCVPAVVTPVARDGGGSRRRKHVDQWFVEQAWAKLEAELAQIRAEKNPKRIAKPGLAKLAKIHRRAVKLDVPVGAALLRQHIEKVEQTYRSVLQDSLQAAKATEDYRLAALIALQARQEEEDEEDIMLLLAA